MRPEETVSDQELARENEILSQQQRAISDVLRAVARSKGLQPVLEEIVESATQPLGSALALRRGRS
jgi:hypothetical protein